MPAPETARSSRPPRARYRWWLLPGILALALGWWWQTDWNPATNPTQALLAQADQALARGHLSAADGSGARELYAAAQAIDPDLPAARQGQIRVGLAALEQARQALAREDLAAARRDLALARQLQVPRVQWQPVAAALRQQERAQVDINALLERAENARRQGWLASVPPEWPEAEAALPLYQRILILHPGHAAALRGREEALADLLEQARAHLRAGRLEEAADAIAIARQHDPGHIDLPDTLARLAEERTAVQPRAAARTEADEHAITTRSTGTHPPPAVTPSLHAARACFDANLAANNLGRARECLDSARAHGEAEDILNTRQRQLAQRWIAIGEERLRRGDLAAATAALAAARAADPATPGLQALAQRLQTAQP